MMQVKWFQGVFTTAVVLGVLGVNGLAGHADTEQPVADDPMTTAVTVTSNVTAPGGPTKRNFIPTGTNALYSKAGTLPGAKLVAGKAALKQLAASTQGQNYFWGYRIAQTSEGNYYMKVVSFDKHYRGWIYIGKQDPKGDYSKLTRGMQSVSTSSAAKMPSSTTMKLKAPGTKHVIWNFPYLAQYGAAKVMKNTQPYANDAFTVTKSRRLKRGGGLYYKVTDRNNPKASGWIYSGALTPASVKAQIKVTLQDAKTKKTLKTTTLANATSASAKNFLLAQLGNGKSDYGNLNSLLPDYDYLYLTISQKTANYKAITGAKYGSSITLSVLPTPTTVTKTSFLATYFDLTTQNTVGRVLVKASGSAKASTMFAKQFKNGSQITINGKKYTYKLTDNASIAKSVTYNSLIAVNVRS